MSVPPEVAGFREEYRARKIGRAYLGQAHLAFTSAVSLAVIAWAAARVRGLVPLELLAVPCVFLLANAAEYFAHRGPMHHRRRGLDALFQRHTLEHHRFFTHHAMSYESWRDVKMVLFPPVLVFFFLGVLATPIAAAVFVLATPNCGWLTVMTMMGYFLLYEWLHFAYHMDARSWVGRIPFVARLRAHHATHHDPGRMGRWNLNITFPICDLAFGTRYRDDPKRGSISEAQ